MLKIKLQKITEDARMPIKGNEHAACYDVYAHSITDKGDNKVSVGLGFKTEIVDDETLLLSLVIS